MLAGNGSNELIEALLLVTVGPGTRGRDPGADLHALRAAHRDPGRRGRARRRSAPTSSTTPDAHRAARRERERRRSPSSARRTTRRAACSPPRRGRAAVRGRRRPGRDRRGVPRVLGRSRWCRCSRDHPNLVVLRTFSKAMAHGRPARRLPAGRRPSWCARSTRRACPTTSTSSRRRRPWPRSRRRATLRGERRAAGRGARGAARATCSALPGRARRTRRAPTSSCSSWRSADPKRGLRVALRARACWCAT